MGEDANSRYAHVARSFFGQPWMIRETEGAVIGAIIRGRLNGDGLDESEITARIEAARATQGPRAAPSTGSVAVIPIYGVLAPRISLMTQMSGGTTLSSVRAAMEEALANEDIAAIIGEFDSPGGSVEGVEEIATWIREARGQKPMVAVVNTMACSAAYYLAAQFDEIVASPSSLTGNIGVFTEHVETSQADATEGVKTTVIRAPASKHDINSREPLTSDGLAHLQSVVDDYYAQFVTAVAKGRGVPPDTVRSGYGQGRELTAARAQAAGLVDRVGTLDATIKRLSSGQGRAAVTRAEASDHPIRSEADEPSVIGDWSHERIALAIAQAELDFEIGDHAHG